MPVVAADALAGFQAASRAIAEKAATLSRNLAGTVPLHLKPGATTIRDSPLPAAPGGPDIGHA